MAEVVAKIRDKTGTGPSRAYRQANLVPAVLYGEGVEAPVHLLVDKLELERLLGAHGLGSIVTVKVPDQADYPAMVKDVQYHPVRGQVIHADFQGISLTKTLRTVAVSYTHLRLEEELWELEPDERAMFLAELDLPEPGLNRLIACLLYTSRCV